MPSHPLHIQTQTLLTKTELGFVFSKVSGVFVFTSDPFEESDVNKSSQEDEEEDEFEDELSWSFFSLLDSLLTE